MNALERAVIEAARAFVNGNETDERGSLMDAVFALDAAAADPERVIEIPWSQVCEGDRLKSVKNGKFYEVHLVGPAAYGYRADQKRIELVGVTTPIHRPTPAEPTAFVKRGPAGNAVDVWVDVLSSGGK